jgi:hypothetical protein
MDSVSRAERRRCPIIVTTTLASGEWPIVFGDAKDADRAARPLDPSL